MRISLVIIKTNKKSKVVQFDLYGSIFGKCKVDLNNNFVKGSFKYIQVNGISDQLSEATCRILDTGNFTTHLIKG